MRFKSFESEIFSLRVNKKDSVKSVVKELAKILGKSSLDILLIFENRILLHNDSIGKYEIDEEDFVLFDCNKDYREFNRNTFPKEEDDQRRIQVRVKEEPWGYRDTKTYVVKARIGGTIEDLRELLSLELEIRRKFELYKGGRLLEDADKTLADYHFDNGDLLTIRYVTIEVLVKYCDTYYLIEVRPEETIRHLKAKLSKRCKLKTPEFFLVYQQHTLSDDKTINDYAIRHNSTIHIFGEIRGGGSPLQVIPVNGNHKRLDAISPLSKFAETINILSKENGVLSMQIDLFSDKNCADQINNDSDYNNVIDRMIRNNLLKIYYKIKSKPSFSLSFVPINIDFEPFVVDCSGDCKSIIDRVSNKYDCPSHSLEYFTDSKMSLQIENIDYFIRNCRHNSNIYFLVNFLVDNFVAIEKLGEGAFGTVYKCREIQSNKIFAAKQFKISREKEEKISYFKLELEIIKSLKDHSRIIKFEGQKETKDAAYLLMEYALNGSLGQYVKMHGALPEDKVANHTKQILEGLHYLHKNNIVHKDIKGDNILLDSNYNIKLCDFGLSKSLLKMAASDSLQGSINSVVGTANWLAPEIICGEEYEFTADIWSFGATMIEMITGRIPFYKYENRGIVIFKIASLKQIEYEYPSNGSTMMKEFIDLCLQPDPRKRAKIDQLFNHQFLLKIT